MLLNNIPCLDKGYVSTISSHNDSQKLVDIANHLLTPYQVSEKLLQLSSLTLLIKCPLFIQLNLAQYGFTILYAKSTPEVEAYLPNEAEVNTPELETSRLIMNDIKQTTEALLINPKAYNADGCDKFTSQVMTPISVYTTIITHGSYDQWKRFTAQVNLPAQIESYRSAVEQIVEVEWKYGQIKDFTK